MNSLFKRGTLGRAAILGVLGLAGASSVGADEGVTIPKGTAVDLVLEDALSTQTTKVGDTFRTRLARPLRVDGQLALPEGAIVEGRVESMKSVRDGAQSGYIGITFERVHFPEAEQPAVGKIEAKLVSQRQDKHRRVIEFAPKVSTGRKTDVVFIGRATKADGRAHTLVGDGAADDYSRTSLSEGDVEVAKGALISMEFDAPLMVSRSPVRIVTPR